MPFFSAAYWLFFCVTLPPFFAVALATWAFTAPFDGRKRLLHRFTCWWGVFYVRVNPLWRLDVYGRERLPREGAAVLVANHASLIDILVLFGLSSPFKWVSKVENFKIPFIGWTMTLNGYVPVRRGDRQSVSSMMQRCRRLLDMGVPLLIFPEGTRSKDGNLKPFKDGAFELAMAKGCPVFPIAVRGTAAALPKHGLVLRQHVNATVEVLAPLNPASFKTVEELREATRAVLAESLGRSAA